MNNKQDVSREQYQKLFREVDNKRELRIIYLRIEAIKLKQEQELLNDLEQICLRGLLTGYTPDKIAQKLLDNLDPFLIQRTFWNLYRYIQTIVRQGEKNLNYQNAIDTLAASGYKAENMDTLLLKSIPQQQPTILTTNPTQERSQSFTDDPSSTTIIPRSRNHVLTPVDENDFMPAISNWTRLGGLFLVGSVGIAIALSAFTPYKATVKASAQVRPAGELKIVEAKTEGTVTNINVEENQPIKRGDIIATIDSSRLETQKHQLQSQIQQSKLQLGQINTQIRTLKRQIKAERDRIQRAIEVATVELNRSQREYRDRQITTQAEVAEAIALVRLAEEEWQQAQAELTSAQANLKSAQAVLASARSRRDRYQKISVSGALSQNQLEEAQLEVEQQQQQIAAQQATVEQQRRGIARQQQAIEAAQARLNNVRAALNPHGGEIAIAISENFTREG